MNWNMIDGVTIIVCAIGVGVCIAYLRKEQEMISRQTLKVIASRLEGTDNDLLPIMRELGVTDALYEVEGQMEIDLDFGYCLGCEMWAYGVEDGLCLECTDERNEIL